jgi:hypothetical protein
MTLYSGLSVRPGIALAAAGRLHVEYGVASFAPERLRRIAVRLRAFGVDSPEPEQVILIADSLPPGFTAATAGLEIVGLALGSEANFSSPLDCPTVIGLGPEFFESVVEDEIIVVDGSRGRVYVAPDAVTLARLQAPAVRSQRIFIDPSHLAARTASEGHPVAVFVPVQSQGDIEHAMEVGADGVCLFPSEDFPDTTSGQTKSLETMLETLGGLPLLLCIPLEQLALSAVARASALGILHLVVSDKVERDEITARLAEIEALLEEDDLPYGTPQFEFCPPITGEADLPDDLDDFTGISVVGIDHDTSMELLLPIAALSQRTRRSLLLSLGSDWPDELPHALTLGAARLLVPLPSVPDVKDAIRAW